MSDAIAQLDAIDAVGVVVPVHDEAALLPGCLAAIDHALARVPRTIRRCVVVVLDTCTDGSAGVAHAWARDARDAGPRAMHGGDPRATHNADPRDAHSADPRDAHSAGPRAAHSADPRNAHHTGSRNAHNTGSRNAHNPGSRDAHGAVATIADRMVVELTARSVGVARAAGMRHALAQLAPDGARLWLATTDADSLVPPDWLVSQLAFAAAGADAVAGSIQVADWDGYPSGLIDRFAAFYTPAGSGDHHTHVHGANLGIRGDAYLAAGGFAALATGEDHALWRALHAAGRRCISSRQVYVTTSARRVARAPDGFSGFLAAMLEA